MITAEVVDGIFTIRNQWAAGINADEPKCS